MEDYFKEHVLGKVFAYHPTWRQPDFVQVIGWTNAAVKEKTKIRYVYVNHITVNREHQDVYGGRGKIDRGEVLDINKNIGKPGDQKLKVNIKDGEPLFLSEGNPSSSVYQYYGLVKDDDYDRTVTWGSID